MNLKNEAVQMQTMMDGWSANLQQRTYDAIKQEAQTMSATIWQMVGGDMAKLTAEMQMVKNEMASIQMGRTGTGGGQ